MDKPYIGQTFISDQFVVFVYIGRGVYVNTVSQTLTDKSDLLKLRELQYRQYES